MLKFKLISSGIAAFIFIVIGLFLFIQHINNARFFIVVGLINYALFIFCFIIHQKNKKINRRGLTRI